MAMRIATKVATENQEIPDLIAGPKTIKIVPSELFVNKIVHKSRKRSFGTYCVYKMIFNKLNVPMAQTAQVSGRQSFSSFLILCYQLI